MSTDRIPSEAGRWPEVPNLFGGITAGAEAEAEAQVEMRVTRR